MVKRESPFNDNGHRITVIPYPQILTTEDSSIHDYVLPYARVHTRGCLAATRTVTPNLYTRAIEVQVKNMGKIWCQSEEKYGVRVKCQSKRNIWHTFCVSAETFERKFRLDELKCNFKKWWAV